MPQKSLPTEPNQRLGRQLFRNATSPNWLSGKEDRSIPPIPIPPATPTATTTPAALCIGRRRCCGQHETGNPSSTEETCCTRNTENTACEAAPSIGQDNDHHG